MTEDFNDGPVVVEDKQSLLCDKEKCYICDKKCGLRECGICGLRFCNDISDETENKPHILFHLSKYKHNIMKMITNQKCPDKFEELKCCKCEQNNIFNLYMLQCNENNDISKYIFCDEHVPHNSKNCEKIFEIKEEDNNNKIFDKKGNNISNNKIIDGKKLLEREELLKEFDDIIKRKLNKVKKTYNNKYDYYQIYKPLIVSDYLYTKKVYENKIECDIDLLVNKNEKYYFQIPEDFIEINIIPGKVLKFIEVNKYDYYNEEEFEELENEEYYPITFVGVISNYFYNDKYQLYDVWIMPLNKHISSLKGHHGKYKIKEEFCAIPYMRMLEALELFQTDEPDDENGGALSLHLTRRILGQYPTQNQIENKKNLENFENFKKTEKKALSKLFLKDIKSKIKTSIENYGELNDSQISSIENVFSNVLNLIQGPPGTGKTFLSSFIVYNIFKYRKEESQKILLCSPSNSATDNLASSLLKLNKVITGKKMKICRVFAKSKEYTYIEDELLNISLHRKLQNKFEVDDISTIPKEELQI